MRHFLFSLAALLALPVMGCSVSSEDTKSSDSDLTLHPTAGGTISLALKAPPVLTLGPEARSYHYFVGTERIEVVPNQDFPRVLPYAPDKNGKTPFRIEYRMPGGGGLALEVPITIPKGLSTLEVAGISVGHDAFDVGAGLIDLEGYEPDGKLTLEIDGERSAWERLPGTPAGPALAPLVILPSLVGRYTWELNGSGTTTTVDPRMVTSIFPGAAAQPFGHVTVSPDPNPSSFPLAHEQTFEVTCPNGKGGSLGLGSDHAFFTSQEVRCQWGFGGARVDADFQPRGTIVLQTARLELDDVELSDEAGVKVPGTYEVFKGDVSIAKGLPTKTGLDLPPGHYRVVISFTRPSGQADQLTQDVDL